MFAISTSPEDIVSLKEYLFRFADEHNSFKEEHLDIELYLTKLDETTLPEFDLSQIECLIYIAGYAVFSYLKKSNVCQSCHDLLTVDDLIGTLCPNE